MADPLPAAPFQALRVPASLQERTQRALELKEPVFAAYRANDPAELRRCLLRENEFLIACTIHDLEHPWPGTPLPPQFFQPAARAQLLRGLQVDLAHVQQQLQQEQAAPAQAAEGGAP